MRFPDRTIVEGMLCSTEEDVQFPLWVEIDGPRHRWYGRASGVPTGMYDRILIQWGTYTIEVFLALPYYHQLHNTIDVHGPLNWLDAINHQDNHQEN